MGALVLAGCALTPPAPGETRERLLRDWGLPTAIYELGGGSRLEYASGPYGRSTWMVDVDASDHVTGARQVLGEASFAAFNARAPGMPVDEVLRTLGQPGQRASGGRQGGEIWSWRYPSNECLWFRVSIGEDRRVRDGGAYLTDPMCDKRR